MDEPNNSLPPDLVIPSTDDVVHAKILKDILYGTYGTIRERACLRRIALRNELGYESRTIIQRLRTKMANNYGQHLFDII